MSKVKKKRPAAAKPSEIERLAASYGNELDALGQYRAEKELLTTLAPAAPWPAIGDRAHAVTSNGTVIAGVIRLAAHGQLVLDTGEALWLGLAEHCHRTEASAFEMANERLRKLLTLHPHHRNLEC